MHKFQSHFTNPSQETSYPFLCQEEDAVSIGVDVLKPSPILNLGSEMPMKSDATNFTSGTQYSKADGKIFGAGQSYLKEWEIICRCCDINIFRSWAFGGDLSACRFRSICWRVYLNIFPTESSKWLSIIRSKREIYETMRHELMVTPGLTDHSLDPNVNNPLSQEEESPWNQYFEDSELKRLIRLDVQRTFPEVEFFQTKRIQEMMVSILFCYARKYPDITYIQGMHEILAPLTFVLNYDNHVHTHSVKDDPTPNLLQEIMDEAHLEHDSFTVFEAVMEKLHHWYEDGEPKPNFAPKCRTMPTQPFARPQDVGPTTKIVQRLTKIHDLLLKKHEPDVFTHLDRLEIPPQVYGIRWARLMFGREFSFSDLLSVWDAIFADPCSNFLLVDYLMVAMLSNIKDRLLAADYITSLNLLMRYPPSSDVHSIVQMALFFRNPKSYSHPGKYAGLMITPTVGGQPNIHRAPQASSTHGYVTRSTSLPRPQSITQNSSSSLKLRSTSVEHNSRSGGEEAWRRSSPTVHAAESFSGMSFTSAAKGSGGEDPRAQDSATTRVVSGLVRLGERLGRPRDSPSPQPEKNMAERPMDELKFVERSAPISTRRASGGSTPSHTNHNSCTSSEGEEDPSFPQKSVPTSPRVSVEDVLAVSLGCAQKLSEYHSTLSTRLQQLQIESDLTLRAAMEGIEEVLDTFRELKLGPRRSSDTRRTPPVVSTSTSKPLPRIHHSNSPRSDDAFSHPLQFSETSDS